MKLDQYEEEVLAAFESGALVPVATREELERIRESARATTTKDQRINIRLSAGDLRDIQVKAMQEGMPPCSAWRPWLLGPRLSRVVTSSCCGYAYRANPGNWR